MIGREPDEVGEVVAMETVQRRPVDPERPGQRDQLLTLRHVEVAVLDRPLEDPK